MFLADFVRLSTVCRNSAILESSWRRSDSGGVSSFEPVGSAVGAMNVVGTGGWRKITGLNRVVPAM